MLPRGSVEEIEQEVIDMRKNLYKNGGLIMQMEAGAGAKAENVKAAYAMNNKLNEDGLKCKQ